MSIAHDTFFCPYVSKKGTIPAAPERVFHNHKIGLTQTGKAV